jgi:hypothetical protein
MIAFRVMPMEQLQLAHLALNGQLSAAYFTGPQCTSRLLHITMRLECSWENQLQRLHVQSSVVLYTIVLIHA